MGIFIKILITLSVPIAILNLLGGVISGIWLIFLGKWFTVVGGIFFLIFSSYFLGFVLIPSLVFMAPLASLSEKRKNIAIIPMALSSIYTCCVFVTWCVFVMWFYTKSAQTNHLIPLLLWSYGIATGPITWLMQNGIKSGDIGSMIVGTFVEVAYIVAVISVIYFRPSWIDITSMFATIIGFGVFIQLFFAYTDDFYNGYL